MKRRILAQHEMPSAVIIQYIYRPRVEQQTTAIASLD